MGKRQKLVARVDDSRSAITHGDRGYNKKNNSRVNNNKDVRWEMKSYTFLHTFEINDRYDL